MAARATKTTLQFGLVKCAVALYKTSDPEKPPTWEKAGPHGGPLLPVNEAESSTEATETHADPLSDDPEEAFAEIAGAEEARAVPVGREEGGGMVTKENVRLGVRKEDGTFRDLTDGLEQIAEQTKLEEMRVADFIRTEQITRERIVGSYWLAADGEGAPKVLRLLYEAMRTTHRVGVVKWTKRSKQSLGVLVPMAKHNAIAVLELAWAEDLREVPERAKLAATASIGEIDIAVELIDALSSGREALDSLTDDARAMRRELIETGGVTIKAREDAVEGAEVIGLMQRGLQDREALKRSAA